MFLEKMEEFIAPFFEFSVLAEVEKIQLFFALLLKFFFILSFIEIQWHICFFITTIFFFILHNYNFSFNWSWYFIL